MPEARAQLRRRILGVLALTFFVVHATFHATHGRAHDILWSCTLSNAIVGIGLLAGSGRAVAVGATWLFLGNLTWLADLCTGGEFLITSTLTHFGGLAVALLGARILGWPRHTFVYASAGMLALQQLCRFVTPPEANVNLAFSIYKGWEGVYPSYRVFWLAMFAQAVLVYFLVDRMFGWLLRRSAPAAARRPQKPDSRLPKLLKLP
jgi:hypothetical protein